MTDSAFSPFFASGALRFAFEKATTEGKMVLLRQACVGPKYPLGA